MSTAAGAATVSLAALPSADILVGNASNVASPVAISGDATLSNAGALTLDTVNSNVGSFTNASVTVNAKGLVTAASSGSGGVTSLSNSDGSITLSASTGAIVLSAAGKITPLGVGSIILARSASAGAGFTANSSVAASYIVGIYLNSASATGTPSFTATGDSLSGTWNPLFSGTGSNYDAVLLQRIA